MCYSVTQCFIPFHSRVVKCRVIRELWVTAERSARQPAMPASVSLSDCVKSHGQQRASVQPLESVHSDLDSLLTQASCQGCWLSKTDGELVGGVGMDTTHLVLPPRIPELILSLFAILCVSMVTFQGPRSQQSHPCFLFYFDNEKVALSWGPKQSPFVFNRILLQIKRLLPKKSEKIQTPIGGKWLLKNTCSRSC